MAAPSRLDTISKRLVPWLIRERRRVLAVALVVSLVALVLSVRLYSDLRSGIEELLPESAPSVVAARVVQPKLHSINRLSVTLEGHDADGLDRFADALATRLRLLPKDLVEDVDYRTDELAAFVRQFGALYVSTEDLRTIRDRVKARVDWERRHHNPLMVLADDDEPAPDVDLSDLEKKYGVSKAATQFRKGYYQTPAGNLLVLQVRPPEASSGLGPNERLLEAVKHEIAVLGPEKFDPTLRFGFSGEVAELVEEQRALVQDIASSTVIVFVFVLAALWLYYRRWSAIFAVLGPLAVGTLLTFAAGDQLVGHLNANTAFLGSIVIGNGINVGIILVARYLEERRRKESVEDALVIAWRTTLPSTFVAAFGAGLAYLSLASTDFRGFSQFGLIGGFGMALCWLSAYVLVPPVVATLEAWRPIDPGAPRDPTKGFGRVVGLVERFPVVFRAISVLLVVACVAAVSRYEGDAVEYDMTRLRSKKSLESGALHWSEKVDEVFQAYLTPVVIYGATPDDLNRTVAALDARRHALGDADPLREVQTLSTLVPENQSVNVVLVESIRAMLPESRRAQLPPDLREKIDRLIPVNDVHAVTLADLPSSYRRLLIERDGSTGRVAVAFPKSTGRLDLRAAKSLKDLLRGAVDDAHTTAWVLNPLLLLSDIDDAIWHDGPKATLVAFLCVCLLVVLVMRRVRPSLEVMASLVVGLAGLVGLAAALGVRVNFLNFVVLPITFGIGVDYAVNIVLRVQQEGRRELFRVLRETGGAVALCSLTTIIGYGSLMVADSQALAGFGLLAAAGEVTCLSAALLLLPAWLARRAPLREHPDATALPSVP